MATPGRVALAVYGLTVVGWLLVQSWRRMPRSDAMALTVSFVPGLALLCLLSGLRFQTPDFVLGLAGSVCLSLLLATRGLMEQLSLARLAETGPAQLRALRLRLLLWLVVLCLPLVVLYPVAT